jgi:penicillin-binding protein 1A
MSIRDALADSRNIPAVKALQAVGEKVGLEKAQKFAQGLGIPLDEIYESYAIGGFREGVSPMQMAGAFSAFGNNGIFIEPHTVKKIVLSDGTEISLAPEPKAAMSDYTAFMITDMMKSVVDYGTAKSVKMDPINVAGKTGTTNFTPEDKAKYDVPSGAAKDAWFVGYNPNYTAAVWTGYNISEDSEKVYLDSSDQRLARAIFKEVFSTVAEGDTSDFEQPNSVVKRAIEEGSMDAVLAGDYTPSSKISYEYFVKGSEPSKVSKKYAKINKPSNLSINYDQVSNTINVSWNYDQGDNVTFEVRQSVDGGSYQVVSNSKNMSYQVGNVTPGSIYSFQVVAVSSGNNRSNAAATKIQVPEPEIEVPELPAEEDQGEIDQNSGEQGDNENNDGNGAGNENGTGNENGNGNGNGNENGNGNGNGNENGNGNDNQENPNTEGETGETGETDPTPPATDASTPPQTNPGREEENNDDGEGE